MNEKVRGFYNNLADGYDLEQESFSFVRVPEEKLVFSTLPKILHSEMNVLEIGAGTGRFTLEIAPKVRRIVAADFSSCMLEQMSKKLQDAGITNVEQCCGDFMQLDFTEQFDFIVSFSALEYIKDPELFAKIAGLLKPGGQLLFTFPHNTFFRWWGRFGNYFRQGVFMSAFSKRQMKKQLNAVGLEVVQLDDLVMKTIFSKGILLFVHAKK